MSVLASAKSTLKSFPAAARLYGAFRDLQAIAAPGDRQVITKREASFFADGFATTHHVGFLSDPKFQRAFAAAFAEVPSDLLPMYRDIAWRVHICTWAASQAMNLDGDFVECGVWYGVMSRTICNYLDFAKSAKRFYLVDSWGEMPGSHEKYRPDIFSIVQRRFNDVPNVHLVRGVVPAALDQIDAQRIAYLAIDMNGSVAERAALEALYPRMVAGGVIYFDDYCWGYPELRATVDEFFRDKPEQLLHFPSGNSIVVKV